MPGTEYQPSFLGRIGTRRNQVMSMEGAHEQELEDFELFQRHIGDRFSDLLSCAIESDTDQATSPASDPLLSIAWLRKLVDVFLCCEAEFKAFLIMGRDPSQIAKPPLDRLISELLDRSIKLLDICNAVSSGIDNVRQCQRFAEIAVNALRVTPIGDGQIKRAKKALTSLQIALTLDEKECGSGHNKSTERAWSFGKRGNAHHKGTPTHLGPSLPLRSFSMAIAKNWSASKQIQSMLTNLTAPRGAEASGLATPVYIISMVMVFTTWALIAAVPCQERSNLPMHFPVSRQVNWAQGMIGLQERIAEEWKKKEKSRTAGLMEEMQRLEKVGSGLMEVFGESVRYPMESEKEGAAMAMVSEMDDICRRMEDGLGPLQHQIRELFHRAVRSRAEMLDLLDGGRLTQVNN